MTIKSIFDDIKAKVKPQITAAVNKQIASVSGAAKDLFQQSKMSAVETIVATPQVAGVVEEYKAAEIKRYMPAILAGVVALILVGYYARK